MFLSYAEERRLNRSRCWALSRGVVYLVRYGDRPIRRCRWRLATVGNLPTFASPSHGTNDVTQAPPSKVQARRMDQPFRKTGQKVSYQIAIFHILECLGLSLRVLTGVCSHERKRVTTCYILAVFVEMCTAVYEERSMWIVKLVPNCSLARRK